MRQRIIGLVITALVLYGVAPAVLEVFGAFDRIDSIKPWGWGVMLLCQAGGLISFWEVQRIAMHTRDWFAVATSNLASGAIGRVIPGGAAAAAALQYQMLVRGGVEGATAATGLTAGSLLLVGTLAALPLLALPAVIGGVHVPRGLFNGALIGLALFAALFVLCFVLLRSDAAVVRIGRIVTWVMSKLPGRDAPDDIADRLRSQRDMVRA